MISESSYVNPGVDDVPIIPATLGSEAGRWKFGGMVYATEQDSFSKIKEK